MSSLRSFKAVRKDRTRQGVNGTAANDLRKTIGKQGVDVVNNHAEIIEEMQQWARTVVADIRVLQFEVKELQTFKDAVIAKDSNG